MHRYELEKELVEGSVKVEQLPKLWNERMTSYLGCTPADDAQGVLQDVHWSAGLFGYFPTYTLGAMFACQIYQVLAKYVRTSVAVIGVCHQHYGRRLIISVIQPIWQVGKALTPQ